MNMRLWIAGVLTFITCLLFSCNNHQSAPVQQQALTATITRSYKMDQVPSASAVEVVGGKLYLIGDDAPSLYRCSPDGSNVEALKLLHLPTDIARIPKPVKPDYEAAVTGAVNGDQCIVAFGSGSMPPMRDSVLIMSLAHPERQQRASLLELYGAIRTVGNIPPKSINIEGAALAGSHLLLLNRGSNQVFTIDWEGLLAHLLKGAPVPAISVQEIELPSVEGRIPRFSGASLMDGGRLVFSASLEDTEDWTVDGEVLGSYVGILDISDLAHIHLVGIAPMLDEQGKMVKEKLEGVNAAQPVKDGVANILGVVDNDDGSSRLLEILLRNIPLPSSANQ